MTALPIFFALRKVDEDKRLVSGIATAEKSDKTGEVCDYDTTKPYYEKWSAGFKKATGGKSLGNVRIMHQPEVAGKLTDIQFNDAEKQIEITAKIVDDNCWKMVLDGCYSGFSQGGEYINKWEEDGLTYYTASPSEVSIVDNPCLGEATFEVIKADGATEMRKFHVKPEEKSAEQEKPAKQADPAVEQGWRAKDGSFHKSKAEAIKHNQFAEAEDIAKAATAGIAKLIGDIQNSLGEASVEKREFTDDARKKAADNGEALEDGSFPIKSENDLKNAIQAVGLAKDPTAAKEHIMQCAKEMDLESLVPAEWKGDDEKPKKHTKVLKSLFDVGRAACLITELDWMHQSLQIESALEGDNSPAPAHLSGIIKELCGFLTSLVEEECGEIVEEHGGTGIENVIEAAAKLPMDHARALGKHLKPGKVADAVAKAASADGEDKGINVKEHAEHVHAIYKSAGNVMQHCMKAVHEMHDDTDQSAEKLVKSIAAAADHLNKAHKGAHEIMQHCMKMGSKLEPADGDDAEEPGDKSAEKLVKMQAVNTALVKQIDTLTAQFGEKFGDLLKRIDHLERQPAVRKGQLFDVSRGHEAQPGSGPVETASSISATIDALRLSPEVQRRISIK